MRHSLALLREIVAAAVIRLPPPSIYAHRIFGEAGFRRIRAWDIELQIWALRQSDAFSAKTWDTILLWKTRRIVRHAISRVPFWADVARRLGEMPIATLEDLRRIPIISRMEMKQLPRSNLVARGIPRWRRARARTSGSTGEPFFFYQDRRDLLRREANTSIELRYANAPLRAPILILGLGTHTDLDPLGRRFSGDDLENPNTRREELYPFIASTKPDVILSTPSLLERFVYFLQRDGQTAEFQAVLYRGEYLSEALRESLTRILKGKIGTVYGTRECSIIALECSAGKLHTAPWMNYLEILRKDGTPTDAGEEGDIVITFFENEVMPFIRYRIGDRGRINPEPCACSRRSPTITFHGREAGGVHTPTGKFVHILGIINKIAVDFHKEILRFQMEQREDVFIFRFEPMGSYSAEAEQALSTYLNRQFEGTMRLVFEPVNHITPNAQDKTPVFSVTGQDDPATLESRTRSIVMNGHSS